MTLLQHVLVFAASISVSMAVPLPTPDTPSLISRQSNGTDGAGTAAQQLTSDQLLSNGIQLNIDVQQGQIDALTIINQLEQSTINSPAQFQTMKNNLLGLMNVGVGLRQNNQAIAPPGNLAINTLNDLAAMQQQEMVMAQSLTGDFQQDQQVLNDLLRTVTRSANLNQQGAATATFLRAAVPPPEAESMLPEGMLSPSPGIDVERREVPDPLFAA